MTGALSWWHIVIVVAVFILLFGSKKLPDAARGLGRSMRIFKSEIKEMQNDGKPEGETPSADGAPQITSGPDGATPSQNKPETERRSA
ncbi:sec-independent protein translocase protein TatA [Williamsia limnetica]|uniref:Sec-independent protein translocase protein TatA n=1 Tax=Williamsia limnetica TaxID=882452 RepID=A0A318RT70_WILLI|nr:Sec-independent protein translocase subunit TatA [Williamsia limnetica]PYE20921.1 sec-independent protein translocase protein TatA [Williamsia limnetica]